MSLGLTVLLAACGPPTEPPRPPEAERACADCHPAEAAAWAGSTHAQALRPAAEALVGVPDGVIAHGDAEWAVDVRADAVTVRVTRGATSETLPAAFVLGVAPVVQLVVARPGGRWQVPPLAWDVRPAGEGGRRWIVLGDAAAAVPDDPLHWDGPAFTANTRCLSCHTTGFALGGGTEGFETRWEAPGVGCAACHGTLAGHPEGTKQAAAWTSDRVLETCAPCHAHASPLGGGALHAAEGGRLTGSHRLTRLDPPWYGVDATVEEEVFEVGPFLRSRMHQAGVACTDCHEPHGAGLRAPGDGVCATCHRPERYATETHHHHAEGTAGCVDCHLPTTTFMAVDVRHDHGIFVPRPDLAAAGGSPSACARCHTEVGEAELARSSAVWWGDPTGRGAWVDRLLRGTPDDLVALAGDGSVPAFVRAAAIGRGSGPPELAMTALSAPTAWERLAAVEVLAGAPPEVRVALLPPRLDDEPVVAFAAAEALADVRGSLEPADRVALDRRLRARLDALVALGPQPETLVRRCGLEAMLGHLQTARAACEQAVALAPWLVPARGQLAEVLRGLGEEAEGERVLREGLARGEDADLRHALGLSLVRQGHRREGVDALVAAHEARPEDPALAYVAAVGLAELGDRTRAKAVLDRTGAVRPWPEEVATWARSLDGPGGP